MSKKKKKKSISFCEEIKIITQKRKRNTQYSVRTSLMEELPETIFFQNQEDKIDTPFSLF